MIIPDWFLEEVYFISNKEVKENLIYSGSNLYEIRQGAKMAFKILSKPSNQAKMLETMNLVNACKPKPICYTDVGTGDEYIRVGLDEDAIKEALKPFGDIK